MTPLRIALVTSLVLACSTGGGGDVLDAGTPPDAGSPPDAGREPVRCEARHACSERLDADGLCPGACLAQPDGPRCGGRVVAGVCVHGPVASNAGPGELAGLVLSVVAMPPRTSPGASVTIDFALENRGARAVTAHLVLSTGPAFELLSTQPAMPARLEVPAGGTVQASARLRALRPTVLVPSEWGALWVEVDNEPRVLELPIDFGGEEAIGCGEATFPAQWCDGEDCTGTRRFYANAKCCDGVFYPGATCCADADCTGGACVDGRCVNGVPNVGLATTLLHSPQRVLLVLSDAEGVTPASPCEDLAPRLAGELQLAEVERWFGGVLRTRMDRAAVPFRWTVFGGLRASEVAGAPPYWSGAFSQAAETWLRAQGCLSSFDDFDKVIVASPLLEPAGGVTAEAFAPGRIASREWTNPLLLAHELGHTFGASDLYLEAGGFLQYRMDLMGNNLGWVGPPSDGVLWGEIGLGDLDRNGVVDLAEFASDPDALDLRRLEATLTEKGTLEVTAEPGGREDGALWRLNVPTFAVELPEYGLRKELSGTFVTVFDGRELDLAQVEAAGKVRVRVRATYRYTRPDLVPRTLELDVEREIAAGR